MKPPHPGHHESSIRDRWPRGWAWILLVGGLGWAAGFTARRTTTPPQGAVVAPAAQAQTRRQKSFATISEPGWKVTGGMSPAEWRELPADSRRKAEAALWLASATSAEIAAEWSALAAEQPRDWGLLDLVMVRWTDLDPLGAVAAVAGTDLEYRAWRAWGKTDPEAATREAKARKSGHLWRVLQGAGTSDPLTAIRLLEENPAFDYPAVLDAIKSGLKDIGWRESLEFEFDNRTLSSWAKYEPAQALRWALDHARQVSATAWEDIVANLDESARATLAKQMDELPTGKLRQNLQSALVAWTAAQDPAKAVQLAAAAETPALRSQLLTVVGARMASNGDPLGSLEILNRVFAEGGRQKDGFRVIRPDGSSSTSSGGSEPLRSWIKELVGSAPEPTLGSLQGLNSSSTTDARYWHDYASDQWLKQDFDGFAAYTEGLPPGHVQDQALGRMVKQLSGETFDAFTSREVFGNELDPSDLRGLTHALQWAASISDPDQRQSSLQSLIGRWVRKDPESAEAHFADDRDATAAGRAVYQNLTEDTR